MTHAVFGDTKILICSHTCSTSPPPSCLTSFFFFFLFPPEIFVSLNRLKYPQKNHEKKRYLTKNSNTKNPFGKGLANFGVYRTRAPNFGVYLEKTAWTLNAWKKNWGDTIEPACTSPMTPRLSRTMVAQMMASLCRRSSFSCAMGYNVIVSESLCSG